MSDLDGLSLEGFDLGAALGIQEPEAPTPAPGPAPEQGGIKVSHRMGARQLWRKAASEKALEEAINWHFQEGDCYHCFSFGDVDSFSQDGPAAAAYKIRRHIYLVHGRGRR